MYTIRYNTNDSVNRYKARLMTKGYVQQHGIDYDETFASVAKIKKVHVLHHMDEKNVFLQGALEEQVYIV